MGSGATGYDDDNDNDNNDDGDDNKDGEGKGAMGSGATMTTKLMMTMATTTRTEMAIVRWAGIERQRHARAGNGRRRARDETGWRPKTAFGIY